MRRSRATTVALVLAAVVLATAGCTMRGPELQRGLARVFSVGDCVAIPSAAPDTLRAAQVPCDADPSSTVGALADGAGPRPRPKYQHLPTRFADPATARLCLVPNLVANHCYVLDMPIGMVQRADCAERDQQGLLVQVTQRLDVHDQQACAAA